jgi:hypothetical protein
MTWYVVAPHRVCGARFSANKQGNALEGDEIRVSVAVLLDRGFTAAGAIQLAGADISGSVRLQGATLGANAEGYSLDGVGMQANRDMWFDRARDGTAFTSEGAIRLAAVSVTGSI